MTSLSLPAAIRAAQKAETVLAEMNLGRWAETFHSSEEAIRQLWEQIEWEQTKQAQNNCEVPDGK